jgi:hypothetical protein
MMRNIIVALLVITAVLGDSYMQNPRGSNDRYNEANDNRDNANRLFDSQNNAKGGYCYGPMMSFYEGSYLSIEWTTQHGCGNPKLYCNIVLQYMCGSSDDPDSIRIRDGTTTTTIPDDEAQYNTKNANGEFVYGMHESFEYYQDCKTRDRNKGLWISDREDEGNLNDGRRAAIFTRQNNNGDRHGFECTEERDYWPYWHASPWVDIAVLTEDDQYCDFYKTNSFNVKDLNHCVNDDGSYAQYNNEAECLSEGGSWVVDESHGVSEPECVETDFSRDNHLGNGVVGHANTWNWTLPTGSEVDCVESDTCECVLRLRYNISTEDGINNSPDDRDNFTDSRSNGQASPVTEDPVVLVNGDELELAIDTTQFGRTFQDRSYVFGLRPRPSGVGPDLRIWNRNVRGKRGNIVQTYPATEYDFVPTNLNVRLNDYIHFQWTGCDTNPNNNAGEGTNGSDRSNMVQIEEPASAHPADDDWLGSNTPLFDTKELRQRFSYLGQTDCPTYEELLAQNDQNENDADQDPENCFKLNAAPAYFDGGLVQMNSTGTFYYMSTRNNNFSNRDQKGSILVEAVLPTWAIIVVAIGGALFVGSLGTAGAMFYARSHPHSGVANVFNKM